MTLATFPSIDDSIKAHLDYYKSKYSNDWVGIFLYGSQNYGLETSKSDVDTKIIILPSFEDLILNRKPISSTLVLPNNEHCDVKDIRLMFECFKKQNINFLEILFTKWRIMNPKYEALFAPIFENREAIANYNPRAALDSMNGMIIQKHKSMTKPTAATQAVIEKYGYDGKDLCHMIRILDFMTKRFSGKQTFEQSLKVGNSAFVHAMNAKEQEYPLDYALTAADITDACSKKLRELFLEECPKEVDHEIDTLFESVLTNIFTYKFRKELNMNA